jgi:hypothetical protein
MILAGLAFSQACSSSASRMDTFAEPEPDRIMVCGAILLEDIDMGFPFSYWDWPVEVTLIGRDQYGNVNHYATRTDREGYYSFPNLPRGSYVLKAVTFQKPGDLPNSIVNDWNSANDTYYLMKYPEEGFPFIAKWFPPEESGSIVNHHITWFGLLEERIAGMSSVARGKVSVRQLQEGFKGQRLWEEGHIYTAVMGRRAHLYANGSGRLSQAEAS